MSEAFTEPTIDSSTRYARQIRFQPIGAAGQTRLGSSSAVIVGMGALGCVLAQHLVRAGVGRVRLIDRDFVEWSNLQRQMLYTEEDARLLLPKAEAAAAHLRQINHSVSIEPIVTDVTPDNAELLLSGFDLVLDGSDNFSVRYLINDFCVKHNVPWIYGAAVGASGMTMTVIPQSTPCYRCMFPEPPAGGTTDTCETAGVIAPIIDIIASIQSTEALKWLSGNQDKQHKTLLQVDLWNNGWTPISIARSRRPDCPTCGHNRYSFLEQTGEQTSAALCGRNTIQITPAVASHLTLEELAERLQPVGPIERNPYLLRLRVDDEISIVLFQDGRCLIQGTDDPVKAKTIYSRIMGI
ncbi:ThiF family adenylyltransferase [Paenibacillus abyssi]|uniref:Thiamine/molybdopterin biosynthesis protein MoeB n=1 Tax=Paenibacillus abyssi TaxID=1340531 RepID=A0A917G802_9BACL|nr:ThiF family adenylyltransferase [Paenibacillus abyssi]GGG26650.1 thiamine/molybdopterin biosynthesis protein MoeB [Paenibacillus abyssi]